MKQQRKHSHSRAAGARRGFTLIELLIVIAIIAILALIAIPNFMEAQIRAKVSRVKADYRSLATGIEAYLTDYNTYPWRDVPGLYPSQYSEIGYRLAGVTTPVAYVTSVDMADPFVDKGTQGGYTDNLLRYQYNYRNYEFFVTSPLPAIKVWALNSLGPDRLKNQGLNIEVWARGLESPSSTNKTIIYDPTNGTASAGDIPRTGGETRYKNR